MNYNLVAAKTQNNDCALFSPEILFDANCEGNPFFGVPPERRRKATTNAAAGGSNASAAAAAGLDGSLRSDDGSTEGTKYVRKDGREGKRTIHRLRRHMEPNINLHPE